MLNKTGPAHRPQQRSVSFFVTRSPAALALAAASRAKECRWCLLCYLDFVTTVAKRHYQMGNKEKRWQWVVGV